MAYAIASGTPWCGHRVQRGTAICAVGEGADGFRGRLKAIRDQNSAAGIPLVMFDGVPNLMVTAEVDRFINDCRLAAEVTGTALRVVFVDTLTTATPGMDQNSTEGMSRVVASLRKISGELQCAVVVIHHVGKDVSEGARGSSVLIGDLDTETRVEDDGPGRFVVRQTKQRDHERGRDLRFVSRSVIIGQDGDGDDVTAVYANYGASVIDGFQAVQTKAEKEAGIDGAILACLMDDPVPTFDEMKSRVGRAKSTISQRLQRMQKVGFAEKIGKMWQITTKGMASLK